jgi:hypothetical protein
MSDWLKRKTIHIGAVWYPSAEPPGPNTFLALKRRGLAVAPLELPDRSGRWICVTPIGAMGASPAPKTPLLCRRK